LALNPDTYKQAVFAVARADAAIVPDIIRWPRPKITDSLQETGAGILVVDDVFGDLGRGLVAEVSSITLVAAGEAPPSDDILSVLEMAEKGTPVPDAHRSGSSTLGIFYTGGTTGRSRGVDCRTRR
jgi:long-chain acyl-CoA synthetase